MQESNPRRDHTYFLIFCFRRDLFCVRYVWKWRYVCLQHALLYARHMSSLISVISYLNEMYISFYFFFLCFCRLCLVCLGVAVRFRFLLFTVCLCRRDVFFLRGILFWVCKRCSIFKRGLIGIFLCWIFSSLASFRSSAIFVDAKLIDCSVSIAILYFLVL